MKLKAGLRYVFIAVGTYAVFCFVLIARQGRLIYFPQPLTEAAADEAYAFFHVERWPENSGADYRGLVKKTVPESCLTNGTVLVFHGNGGGAHERSEFCDVWQMLGWRVILAEYPGYGARRGRMTEVSFREDGRATARLVRQQYPGRLVILGESLGSGVAASVADDPELEADAVVLATPWDSLPSVAAAHYPWLPVRFFLRDRYDSTAYLKAYDGSVTILMAEDDEIMPASCTLALYEALPHADRKLLIRIPWSGHNEWFCNVTDAQWLAILPKR